MTLEYDLAQMKTEDGSPLYNAVEAKTAECAMCAFPILESSPEYKFLKERLPSERLRFYFILLLKKEFRPYILQGFVIQWHQKHSTVKVSDAVVRMPNTCIFKLLERFWDIRGVRLLPVNRFSPVVLIDPIMRDAFMACLKDRLKSFLAVINLGPGRFAHESSRNSSGNGFIACHYSEGISFDRRNDIQWFPGSGIRPEQVLIYFDEMSNVKEKGKAISREVISQIEAAGFKWAVLRSGIVEGGDNRVWTAPLIAPSRPMCMKSDSCPGKWVAENGNRIIREVHYWRSFHNHFNIKVHYITEEGFARNIAQMIAFDIDEKEGILIGRQRSEIFLPALFFLAYHIKHIFFVWNRRVGQYLKPDGTDIEGLVISGYQNHIFQKYEDRAAKLRSHGAQFIIALFDSGHGYEVAYSTKTMSGYYESFLRWVIDDPSIGLIIKPKKPKFYDSLNPLVHKLFARAVATGRCIMVDDAWGKLPAEIAVGADIAVGIGSPSAVLEAVLTGCRGVFYDVTNMIDHEFYSWGDGRLVFNDCARMIKAIRLYKEEPQVEPALGDWSGHLEELDPFRDGKGGARMGMYMKWLLDSLDNGDGKAKAIEKASARYAEKWGSDKVISLMRVALCLEN